MSQENHQMCSNSNGGSRSSRKIKQNKAPQRGLGVEKLERIRLEEQRKSGVVQGPGPVVLVPVPPLPPPNQLLPKPSVQFPSPPVSFPSTSLSDLSSMPSIPSIPSISSSLSSASFGPSHSSHNHYAHRSVTPPTFGWSLGSMDSGGGGFNPSIPEHTEVDTDFASSKLHHDFKPNWPPLLLMQWKQVQQHQYSSLMNTHLSTSSPSGPNCHIEHPSNQNQYNNFNQSNYNNMKTLCQEEKILGMKRSWPFSLDNLPDSFFPSNVASLASDFESYGNGHTTFRQGPSGSTLRNSSDLHRNKRIKENGAPEGDFLSLGLSRSTLCSSTIKFKQPLAFLPPDYQELSKIELHPFHGCIEDQVGDSRGLLQHQYSFFPPKEEQLEQSTSTSKGGVGDGVDLTLKL